MKTNLTNEEKNPFETDENREEKAKLQIEAARLKCRLLEIKKRQMELIKQEKKKKMKESTPPPLKERKEIRKEGHVITTTTTKKEIPENQKKETTPPPVFVPPSVDEVQAYMDEIGETRFTALKFWNYYESRGWILGKAKMKFWKRVVDNWVSTENERVKWRRGAKVHAAQQNIVAFNAYTPVDNTGAISLVEYERLKKEGKL
jgi:hypothetical protein